jgi:uncharacterized phage-associated protein
MMISALDVAWYFVQKGGGDPSITQLKLQKLCYYAQGFYLAVFGEPLFSESIEAWDYGPLVVELRQIHSHRGAETIFPYELAFGQEIVDEGIRAHLEKIWLLVGHHKPGKLIDMTHSESPWKDTYRVGQNVKIGEDLMLHYFLDRLEELDSGESKDYCESTSYIYLKEGQVAQVPSSKAEAFLIANQDILEPKQIKTRGQRRRLAEFA